MTMSNTPITDVPPAVGTRVTWVAGGLRYWGHVFKSSQDQVSMVLDDVALEERVVSYDLGCVHWRSSSLEQIPEGPAARRIPR